MAPLDPPIATGPPAGRASQRVRDPRRVLGWAQRLLGLLSLLALFYLWQRYDTLVLPGPCSPLVRLSPGSRLWVDRRPPRYEIGDVVFFEGPEGRIHIGELRNLRGESESAWIEADDPACPGLDSRTLDWIATERLRGRLVLATSDG